MTTQTKSKHRAKAPEPNKKKSDVIVYVCEVILTTGKDEAWNDPAHRFTLSWDINAAPTPNEVRFRKDALKRAVQMENAEGDRANDPRITFFLHDLHIVKKFVIPAAQAK